MSSGRKTDKRKLGWVVFFVLMVVKVVEYLIAITWPQNNLPWMIIMAIIAGGLIMANFMHFGQLFSGEEE